MAQQNSELEEELRGKVSALKSLTIDIGTEVREHNRLLKDVDDDFDSTLGKPSYGLSQSAENFRLFMDRPWTPNCFRLPFHYRHSKNLKRVTRGNIFLLVKICWLATFQLGNRMKKITIVLDEKDETIIFLCGLFLRNALTEWHPNTRRKLSPTSCA